MCGGLDRQGSGVGVEMGRGAEDGGEGVGAVPELEPAEDGDPEVGQAVGDDVEQCPASVDVVLVAGEPAEGDRLEPTECSRAEELGELAVDMARTSGSR